jgi:hypothetical protein
VDGLLDVGGLVEHGGVLDIVPDRRAGTGQCALDPVGDLDHVGVLLLDHGDDHGVLTAGAGQGGPLRVDELHVRDVRERDRVAIGRGQRGRSDLVEGLDALAHLDRQGFPVLFALTGGGHGAGGRECVRDGCRGDLVLLGVVLTEGDADLLFLLPGDIHPGHARHGLEFGDQGVVQTGGQCLLLVVLLVIGGRRTRHGELDHRGVVDRGGDDLDLGAFGEIRLHGVDGGADRIGHLVLIGPEGPQDCGADLAGPGLGGHRVHVLDGGERRLERLGDLLLEHLGGGTWQRGRDDDPGGGQGRQRLLVQGGGRHHPEHRHHRGQQGDDDAVDQAHPGQDTHAGSFGSAAGGARSFPLVPRPSQETVPLHIPPRDGRRDSASSEGRGSPQPSGCPKGPTSGLSSGRPSGFPPGDAAPRPPRDC